MIGFNGGSFPFVFSMIERAFKDYGRRVETARWQGREVRSDPSARTVELRNLAFEIDLKGVEDLDHWRQQIQPNLPWADDHFAERVGGEPLNPGVEWANWPWAKSADSFRQGRFNHNYMERLWPKYARHTDNGSLPRVENDHESWERRYPAEGEHPLPMQGIDREYGDLQDLVELLAGEPDTRQGFIPLFFPEDTGVADGGRKPCTLGYQVMVRDDQAHIWYPMRSVDYAHHLRDDCYMAVRLLLWIIDRCRARRPEVWGSIVPGSFAMHATSLHVFANDYQAILNKETK